MKKNLQKFGGWLKKTWKKHPKKIIAAAVILLIASPFIFRGEPQVKRDVVEVERKTVSQEINVTGRVVPVSDVALAIQSGGKVTSLPVKVGDRVSKGQNLVSVDSGDLYISLERAKSNLERAKLELSKAEPSTRSDDSLAQAYEDAANSATSAFIDFPNILNELEIIGRSKYLELNNISWMYGAKARQFRDMFDSSYKTTKKSYEDFSNKFRLVDRNSSRQEIEAMIDEAYAVALKHSDLVKITKNLVEEVDRNSTIHHKPDGLAEDKVKVSELTNKITYRTSDLLSAQNQIKNSKQTVTDTGHDISSIRLSVRQSELDVQDILVRISERSIKSPFAGIVTKVDTKIGETISVGMPVISVISDEEFQIQVDLPEIDIAKVRVGDKADVQLDAYGRDVVFSAEVVSVDPAENIIDGVATYKTTLQFYSKDDRIKSGMTADVVIKGESKENVLAVPFRAVTTKDDGRYIQVIKGEEVEERKIEIGLRGSDGSVEIVNGLEEGESVVVFTSN